MLFLMYHKEATSMVSQQYGCLHKTIIMMILFNVTVSFREISQGFTPGERFTSNWWYLMERELSLSINFFEKRQGSVDGINTISCVCMHI